ncbi:MAG: hypothetical protein V3W51_04850 [Candidatus Brocadiales bacterium]
MYPASHHEEGEWRLNHVGSCGYRATTIEEEEDSSVEKEEDKC